MFVWPAFPRILNLPIPLICPSKFFNGNDCGVLQKSSGVWFNNFHVSKPDWALGALEKSQSQSRKSPVSCEFFRDLSQAISVERTNKIWEKLVPVTERVKLEKFPVLGLACLQHRYFIPELNLQNQQLTHSDWYQFHFAYQLSWFYILFLIYDGIISSSFSHLFSHIFIPGFASEAGSVCIKNDL